MDSSTAADMLNSDIAANLDFDVAADDFNYFWTIKFPLAKGGIGVKITVSP
ncbi:hypothetical protein [Candidatus Epulonipiscium viviparus]|uniref:hypothetical protein n=1 Tax=Candidatus Epulonipiscium viviparus TaxID=420336 RepID=UPI002738050C|nr:hypothetical protein [Candidatus Epulopiscium viviparus]